MGEGGGGETSQDGDQVLAGGEGVEMYMGEDKSEGSYVFKSVLWLYIFFLLWMGFAVNYSFADGPLGQKK